MPSGGRSGERITTTTAATTTVNRWNFVEASIPLRDGDATAATRSACVPAIVDMHSRVREALVESRRGCHSTQFTCNSNAPVREKPPGPSNDTQQCVIDSFQILCGVGRRLMAGIETLCLIDSNRNVNHLLPLYSRFRKARPR